MSNTKQIAASPVLRKETKRCGGKGPDEGAQTPPGIQLHLLSASKRTADDLSSGGLARRGGEVLVFFCFEYIEISPRGSSSKKIYVYVNGSFWICCSQKPRSNDLLLKKKLKGKIKLAFSKQT